MAFEGAIGQPTLIGHFYRAYGINALNSLIGVLWAAADALVVGATSAWLYKVFAGRLRAG
jgi:hypothetical protein